MVKCDCPKCHLACTCCANHVRCYYVAEINEEPPACDFKPVWYVKYCPLTGCEPGIGGSYFLPSECVPEIWEGV